MHEQVQRYEGASTTYGPHTLEAYQLIMGELAQSMADVRDTTLDEYLLAINSYVIVINYIHTLLINM